MAKQHSEASYPVTVTSMVTLPSSGMEKKTSHRYHPIGRFTDPSGLRGDPAISQPISSCPSGGLGYRQRAEGGWVGVRAADAISDECLGRLPGIGVVAQLVRAADK